MEEAEHPSKVLKVKRRRPSKRRSCLVGLILIILLVPILTGCSYAVDAMLVAPWAYPVFGRPTLTGTWEGQFQTPSGLRFAIALNLHRTVLANGQTYTGAYQGALINGEADWCDSKGRCSLNVPVSGVVPTHSGYNGSADRLEIDLDNTQHPVQGLLPQIFTGNWMADKLTLQPTFAFWTGSTFDYSRDNPDIITPITVELKKDNPSGAWNPWAPMSHAFP